MKDLHPRMYFRNARLQMWFLESCKGQAPELVLPIAEFKGRSFLWIQTNGLTPRSTGLRFTSKPIPTPNFTQKPPNPGKQYHSVNAVCYGKYMKTGQRNLSAIWCLRREHSHKPTPESVSQHDIAQCRDYTSSSKCSLAILLLRYPREPLLFIHRLNTLTPQGLFHYSCSFDDFKGYKKESIFVVLCSL